MGFYEDKNICVMDFFAGTGTTLQAVMQLNKEDGGTRRNVYAPLSAAGEKRKRECQTQSDGGSRYREWGWYISAKTNSSTIRQSILVSA